MAYFIYAQSHIDYVINCKVVVEFFLARGDNLQSLGSNTKCVLPVTST
jgi:hypothetical protein